jgi:hypothetical protein
MISPELLTKENGFVEGCVVEIETQTGNLVQYWDELNRSTIPDWCEDGFITAIRPLTGPMAIWNHAPEWAEYAYLVEKIDDLWHYSWSKTKQDNPVFLGGWLALISERPFWARSKE